MYKNLMFAVVTALFLSVASTSQITVKAKEEAAFKKIDFLNYTYDTRLCADNFDIPARATIKNGDRRNKEYYFTVDNKKVLYGDVTGDTRTDAVVPVNCSAFAGNFVSTEIFVFAAQSGKAKLLAIIDNNSLERDYKRYYPKGFIVRVAPKGVKIENGKISVDVYADGSNASPEHLATMVYFMKFAKPTIVGKPKLHSSGI